MAQTTLTVWRFSSPDGAQEASETLERLAREQVITIHDAATVSWEEGTKKPKTRQLASPTTTGALGGTFWGLLETINSVADTINSLSLNASEDITAMFAKLKGGLEAPLSGMGLAFSTSMMGLAGSLILGFLDLQAGQAQNRFYNDLEEWLAGTNRGPSAGGRT